MAASRFLPWRLELHHLPALNSSFEELTTVGSFILLQFLSERELSRVAAVARQTLTFYKDTTSSEPVDIPVMLEQILALYGQRLEKRD